MGTGQTVDLLVIGGGINGAGIARDAVGRGLSVLLCEQGDLAGATSSASSKLIHGGLRYLETYEFRLVREALAEREVLLRLAPHIIRPMRFVLPHEPGLRPAWLVRLGLFLYDHIGGRRSLPGTASVDFRADALGAALAPGHIRGFAYSDCWVEDSRLVVLNAVDANERGAEILTRTRFVSGRRADGAWDCVLVDRTTNVERRVRARALVNAAGPWVGSLLGEALGRTKQAPVRLVKGSHIVVPRLHDDARALILQNTDRRVVFAIPYEGRFTLIGTTDVPFDGDPGQVAISAEETLYLCDAANRAFRTQVAPEDVIHAFAGVRPLYDDGRSEASKVTRDYVLDLEDAGGVAPILSIFGGKITTYRRLAEHAMEKLLPFFPAASGSWTDGAPLPGGDLPEGIDPYLHDFSRRHPWLAEPEGHRLCRLYGTRAERIVARARGTRDLGVSYGAGLTEAELEHLITSEFARTAEDVLWRRTRLGLHLSADGIARLRARFRELENVNQARSA